MLSQSNALAEIALALAMAFFSIMILSMVSMGAVHSSQAVSPVSNSNSLRFQKSEPASRTSQPNNHQRPVSVKDMVIFYKGRFLDGRLNPIDKVKLNQRAIRILAVDPGLPSAEAIELRSLFTSEDLTLTVLSQDWLNALKENIE